MFESSLNTVINVPRQEVLFCKDNNTYSSLQKTIENPNLLDSSQYNAFQVQGELQTINSNDIKTLIINEDSDSSNLLPEYKSLSINFGYKGANQKKKGWSFTDQSLISENQKLEYSSKNFKKIYNGRSFIFFDYGNEKGPRLSSIERWRCDDKARIFQSKGLHIDNYENYNIFKIKNFENHFVLMNFMIHALESAFQIRWLIIDKDTIPTIRNDMELGQDDNLHKYINSSKIPCVNVPQHSYYFFNIVFNHINDKKCILIELTNLTKYGKIPDIISIQKTLINKVQLEEAIHKLYTPIDGIDKNEFQIDVFQINQDLYAWNYERVVSPLKLFPVNRILDLSMLSSYDDGIYIKESSKTYFLSCKSGLNKIIFEFEQKCQFVGIFIQYNKIFFVQFALVDEASEGEENVEILTETQIHLPLQILIREIKYWAISYTGQLVFVNRHDQVYATYLMKSFKNITNNQIPNQNLFRISNQFDKSNNKPLLQSQYNYSKNTPLVSSLKNNSNLVSNKLKISIHRSLNTSEFKNSSGFSNKPYKTLQNSNEKLKKV